MGASPCKRRTLPGYIFIFHSSSAVEQSAVNRSVVGSIPTCGAIFGELSERLKEHDWKSCRRGRHVSRVQIPCSPPLNRSVFSICLTRPVGQVVKTPPFHGGNTGSNPVRVISILDGGLAQLGEHLPYKQGVGGSIPSSSTIICLCRLSSIGRATDL